MAKGRKREADLTGARYGAVVVQRMIWPMEENPYGAKPDFVPRSWTRAVCLCDCGKVCILTPALLRDRFRPSCGCLSPSRTLDIAGERFGMLVAQRILPLGARPGRRWDCLCDCGRVVAVRAKDLRYGNSTSCGCRINRPEVNRDTLSARQVNLLDVMATRGGSIRQTEVCVLLETNASSGATRNLSSLERRGLIVRRADHEPARRRGCQKLVELLPAGFALVNRTRRMRAYDQVGLAA